MPKRSRSRSRRSRRSRKSKSKSRSRSRSGSRSRSRSLSPRAKKVLKALLAAGVVGGGSYGAYKSGYPQAGYANLKARYGKPAA